MNSMEKTDRRALAEQAALRIRLYWAGKGFDVRTWVVEIDGAEDRDANPWGVRSDLVDGLPQRKLETADFGQMAFKG